MFDHSKPNIILLSDLTDIITMPKTLGPYKVAYTLRQHGYSVAIIHHLSVFSIDEVTQMLDHLVNDQTVFVGVNNFFYSDVGGLEVRDDGGVLMSQIKLGSILPHGHGLNQYIKEFIKRKNPKCALVLGGPIAADYQANQDFDYVVTGYAEKSIVNLANHLSRGEPLHKSYRSLFGFTVLTDSVAEGYNFEQSHMEYEDYDGILPREILQIEIGRGCIFQCTFCSYPMNGKKKNDYIRHRDLIRQELITNYEKFGVTIYQIVDDTFNDSVEKCKMMAEISQSLPFKLEYWAYIRLDLLTAHPETVDYLFGNGLKGCLFGIETFNEKSAKFVGKGGNRQRQIETLRKIKQKYGNTVGLHGNFIFGLPYETPESLQYTIDWMLSEDCPLDSWSAFALNIRPTTSSNFASNGFTSQIDRDWKNLGYVEDTTPDPGHTMYDISRHKQNLIWRNKHFDYLSLKELCNKLWNQSRLSKKVTVSIQYAFQLAGLGHGLDSYLNCYNSDLDWQQVDQLKMQRMCQYKDKVWKGLNIPNCPDFLQQINEYGTYSNYLKQLTQKDKKLTL